ncbi:putative GntR family transcriptional regulator [Microlunatus phosphovorus NM-1]|uniref:Putative GntR family transcriptional regulator n=1 Tax=Microlunatus phosphovorus (strain ATCC 700054 / DSM 10555 / JCM 9379 / NBRC 101784 / NCIMB 13414 / VKM Ac-1990 / NM-1) TaxID=1032480 RepID=F5XEH8_MICPN|nr:GntR family transcriptional regulator [Microlunatus phosphovorus]BAK35194.1 putative GntR family transcriptional regulator [Microlunatus phosphovorus NM-1]
MTALSLREAIARLIADDGLGPGDRLPTETRLAERFEVARSTVREALKRLEEEGLVDAVQGKGRFVSALAADIVERPITRYEGVAEMLTRLGYRVTTSVFSVAEVAADQQQAQSLAVELGTPLIRLERLRYGDDQPLVFSIDHLLRDALPGPLGHRDWSTSLTGALAAHGREVTTSVARISAVELPAEIADRHRLTGLGPWLLVTETCLTRTGRRVLLAEDYHRGAMLGFNVRRRR